MNRKTRMLKLCDTIVRAASIADRSYTRSAWHPGTETARKELARVAKWDGVFDASMEELRALIRQEEEKA